MMNKVSLEMVSFERAFEIVINSGFEKGTEQVHFNDSLGRVLARDVESDIDMPPFTKASMDGFACRKADLGDELEIIETIPAGSWPSKRVGKGECSRIMTGAPLPEGADCVIMVEETRNTENGKIFFTGSFKKLNIAGRGEDVRKGETVLKKGTLIRPQDIAVLAATGNTTVTVGMKPGIAVISSGDELVEPSEKPGLSQIRNSNSSQLLAQIERVQATGKYYGIAPDNEDRTFGILEKAMAENDIVLITGGVSMGHFDFVPSVMKRAGVRILFDRVAVQPGKPTTFGIHSGGIVFGLPGNPVSSFIQFEMLVKPLVYRMMGCNWNPFVVNLQADEMITRSSADRMALIPVKIIGNRTFRPVEFHGSAHISALHNADGIISVPVGKLIVEKGEIVSVRQI